MQIVLSANNLAEVFVMPHCPPGINIENGQTISDYDGLSNHLTMPGNLEPIKVSWEALYPCRRYKWITYGADTDPQAFVEFIQRWRAKKWPIRCTITDKGKTILNIAVLVESFSYSYDRVMDMNYSIGLTEYKFI